jgi:hypothetical protein
MAGLAQHLPNHLKHLQHSALFKALERSVAQFAANKIVDDAFLGALVRALATEFEKACDRQPVNSKALEIADSSQIANYRFDRGYWEIVVPKTSVLITDNKTTTVLFRDSVNVAIEGSGGGLRKGKRKSESIKRAHTRQVAHDTRRKDKESDEDEGYDDEDEDWNP